MNRLFRLLPLASLVLTLVLFIPPRGLAKARIRRSGASTSRLFAASTSSRPAGRLPISPTSKKSMPASSGSKPVRTAIACC